jgi:hypothetical protein
MNWLVGKESMSAFNCWTRFIAKLNNWIKANETYTEVFYVMVPRIVIGW